MLDTIPDFLRKYGDCYIHHKKTKQIFYISNRDVYREENRLQLISNDQGPFEVRYNEDFFNSYNLDFPETGFFQYKKWALLCLKGYARQYCRGLSRTTTNIYNPFSYFNKYIKVPGVPKLRDEIADVIWNRVYYKLPLVDARELLLSKKLYSLALNSEFSLSLSHTSSGFILWNLVSPVAEIDIKETKIIIIDDTFKQEVRDYLNRTHQQHVWRFE